jgi:predicted nucleic acid-binding Zn ribbon protein
MEQARDILGRALRRADPNRAPQAWLEGVWPAIVGAQLAAQTRPLRCSGGVLEISAGNAEWAKQLEPMADDFLRKINASWGGPLVRELRFVAISSGKKLRHEDDNDYVPFIRKRRGE